MAVAIAAALFVAALPAGALAQGAGDDQYADPFGDMPVDDDGGGGGGGGDDGGGNTGGGGGDPTAQAPAEPAPVPVQTEVAPEDPSGVETAQAGEELPRTGLPAGMLALTGLALLALGTLIHFSLLRFAPHSGYARAWRMQPLHQAPRPPGFAPLNARRRFRRRR